MSSQQCVSPCRCEFVQQWLEDHAKYFAHTVSKPELPPLVTRIANRSYPSQAQIYQCSEAVQIRSMVTNTLYIQPPYKTSHMKSFLPVRNNQNKISDKFCRLVGLEPRSRASPEQFAVCLEFMKSHGDLTRSQKGAQGRLKADRQWQKLVDLLNAIGLGVVVCR